MCCIPKAEAVVEQWPRASSRTKLADRMLPPALLARAPSTPAQVLSICLKTLQGRETSSDPSCCANHDQTVTCMALSWGPGPTEAHILPVLASMGQWDKSPPAPLCSVASRLSPQSFLHSIAACFSTKILGVTLLVSGHPGSLLLLLELPAAGGK